MNYREEKYISWLRNSKNSDADFKSFVRKNTIIAIKDGDSWARRYLKKANHNLDFAVFVADLHSGVVKEKFPDQTFYDWVVTAYYYAVYHAALALLAKIGFKSKSHMATLCGVINYYYHETRSLDKRHLDILEKIKKENVEQFIESQDLRERASYGVSLVFEERLSKIARDDAVEFVNKARQILGTL